MQKIKQKS